MRGRCVLVPKMHLTTLIPTHLLLTPLRSARLSVQAPVHFAQARVRAFLKCRGCSWNLLGLHACAAQKCRGVSTQETLGK